MNVKITIHDTLGDYERSYIASYEGVDISIDSTRRAFIELVNEQALKGIEKERD